MCRLAAYICTYGLIYSQVATIASTQQSSETTGPHTLPNETDDNKTVSTPLYVLIKNNLLAMYLVILQIDYSKYICKY